jgi:glycosyltransferase involved in cell wall biosynthesis
MRVVHLSFSDRAGGAARAAYRLHEGLLAAGVDSRMLVLKKSSQDPRVIPIRLNRMERLHRRSIIRLEKPSRRRYPAYDGSYWSTGRVGVPVLRQIHALTPDIVHLHWIGGGFVSIADIARITQPLVWTMHDMWTFTGGCHYSKGCQRYQDRCGKCPILGSHKQEDLSNQCLKSKLNQWQQLKLHAVAPSQWLANCARSSTLLRQHNVRVIPNGLDLNRYRPLDQALAREVFDLPKDRKLILFGAHNTNDPRKGFAHLHEAIQRLPPDQPYSMVTFGTGDTGSTDRLPFPVHTIAHIDDERLLSLLYAAADVFVAPSVEDNLPNVIAEAMACGTPCVAFHIGGMPDMIDHQVNGYLARPLDAADLATGIDWVLTDHDRYCKLILAARERAEQTFTLSQITARYIELYGTLLGTS